MGDDTFPYPRGGADIAPDVHGGQCLCPDGHHDGMARVQDVQATDQTVGRAHGDAADHAAADLLLHLGQLLSGAGGSATGAR